MKKKSIFYTIYFSLIGLFAVMLTIGIVVLWNFLSAYESSLPLLSAESVLKSIEDETFDYSKVQGSKFDSKDDIKQYILNQEGELKVFKPSVLVDENTYVLKAGSTKLLNIKVKESGKKGKFGLSFYEVESVSLATASDTVTVHAPECYTVSVNGVALSDADITNRDVKGGETKFLPQDLPYIKVVEYKVAKPLSVNSVTVSDGNKSSDVSFDSTSGVYTAELFNDESLANRYNDYVIKAIEYYALCMQEQGALSNLSPYVLSGSPFYKKAVSVIDSTRVREHSGYEFENRSATDFYAHSDDIFSCRVKLTLVMHATGKEDYRDKIDLILYLKKSGNGYKIYDSVMGN